MLVNAKNWSVKNQWDDKQMGKIGNYANTKHPFTRVQVTKKGLDKLADHVGRVREIVGYDTPFGRRPFWPLRCKTPLFRLARP